MTFTDISGCLYVQHSSFFYDDDFFFPPSIHPSSSTPENKNMTSIWAVYIVYYAWFALIFFCFLYAAYSHSLSFVPISFPSKYLLFCLSLDLFVDFAVLQWRQWCQNIATLDVFTYFCAREWDVLSMDANVCITLGWTKVKTKNIWNEKEVKERKREESEWEEKLPLECFNDTENRCWQKL